MISQTNSQPQGIRLTDQQKLNWLRLIRSDNIGPASFRELIAYCGSAANALEQLPQLARSTAKRPLRIHTLEQAERELEAIELNGARLIGMGEPDYPLYLKHIPHPPPLVIAKGNLARLQQPPLAIVGARNASAGACAFTATLSHQLGNQGFCIISGLARGIDTSAHQASLTTGTIAVLAGGLDQPYPPQNLPLIDQIIDHGGIILTEMPMGWVPRAQDFPRRNRIIAGLSLGLAVIEAAQRSGSLISARLAAELGRLVFAVPGSPLDPRAAGTNQLLKNGAILLTEAQDIVSAVTPMLRQPAAANTTGNTAGSTTGKIVPSAPPLQPGLFFDDPAQQLVQAAQHFNTGPDPLQTTNAAQQQRICEALSHIPTSTDMLIRHTGLSAATVHLAVLELDLAGKIRRCDNGLLVMIPDN